MKIHGNFELHISTDTEKAKDKNTMFSVVLIDDSMKNPTGKRSYPAGTHLIADASKQPKMGDFVVARLGGGDMAGLYADDAGHRALRFLNPHCGELPLPSDAAIRGVVIMTGRDC